jgi:5-methylcytosine-specific restriction endonuclease McrA
MDLIQEFKNIEDYLIPGLKLDPVERSLYYHLLRHTRIIGKEGSLFGILSLAEANGVSESTIRERIRKLDEKGCIKIEERSAKGHFVHVCLPEEIVGLVPRLSEIATVNIDEVDFYTDRVHIGALVERENGKCFYCLRTITPESCVLDHVISQVARGDNSFKNVVACCHGCNATKQGQDASEYLRAIYRAGLLSQVELQERMTNLERLQQGRLVPEI